jgi:hypothetical protein
MHEIRQGGVLEFACRVGHTYSPRSFVQAHGETEERSLWAAVVSLEEGADLLEQYCPPSLSGVTPEQARRKRELASIIREALQAERPVDSMVCEVAEPSRVEEPAEPGAAD